MRLQDVQAHASTLLMASPALAPLGAPLLWSPFLDEQAHADLIADRLRTTGVCIEISSVWSGSVATVHPQSALSARAVFEVCIAESFTLTHAPTDSALLEAVVQAMLQSRYAVEFESFGPEGSFREQGYVLHVLRFSIPILFK
jgi:uncharacterized MnhB-related membrane protein